MAKHMVNVTIVIAGDPSVITRSHIFDVRPKYGNMSAIAVGQDLRLVLGHNDWGLDGKTVHTLTDAEGFSQTLTTWYVQTGMLEYDEADAAPIAMVTAHTFSF